MDFGESEQRNCFGNRFEIFPVLFDFGENLKIKEFEKERLGKNLREFGAIGTGIFP